MATVKGLQYRVANARREFFSRGRIDTEALPRAIAYSWQRCLGSGLDEGTRPEADLAEGADLALCRERNRLLLAAADADVETLYEHVSEYGATVVLTDAHGRILLSRGDAEFLRKAERVNLRPGALWSEECKGTNAIGTAIADGEAVSVRGGEHYLARLAILSCAATPVVDPRGNLAGVLDVSYDARIELPHALTLIRMSVQNVEHRMFRCGFEGCLIVRCHTRPDCLGTTREGVLVFDDEQLVAANRLALHLVERGYADLRKVSFRQIFDTTPGIALALAAADSGSPVRLPVAGGRQLFALVGEVPRAARTIAPAGTLQAAEAAAAMPRRRGASPAERTAPLDASTARQVDRAIRVLDAGIPVLLTGETGTGKEVCAHALHARSSRREGPFVDLNCAAVPEGLIESELFGYVDGAFTGARRRGMTGKLREAHGGVLFLDEIGDMPLAMQARLLRALQEKEVTPLGGGRPHAVDIAVVCATHRDLDAMMQCGAFRADLYFRLAQFVVQLPALRDRPDLPAIVDCLFQTAGARERGVRLSSAARAALLGYAWPGNLRQLASLLRTLVVLSADGEEIGLDALPPYIASPPPASRPADEAGPPKLAQVEIETIHAAIERSGGNVRRAARSLGIDRSTLYRKLQRHRGLTGPI